MSRSRTFMLMLILIGCAGCREKATPSTASSPASSPSGPAQPLPSAQSAPSPRPAGTATPAAGAALPAQIPERLRRPLTREEIMKLPPATRDMILRAQGQPVPSPTPKKKN